MTLYARTETNPLAWALARAETFRRRREAGYPLYPYMTALIELADAVLRQRTAQDQAAQILGAIEFDGQAYEAIQRASKLLEDAAA